MAETSHTHEPVATDSSGMGYLFGVLLLIIFLYMLFAYGLPYLRGGTTNTTPEVNVPDQIDVNLNQGGQQ